MSRTELLDSIHEICEIIQMEMPLKYQDEWLKKMLRRVLYIPEEY